MRLLFFILTLAVSYTAISQPANVAIQTGNEAYRQKQYPKAEAYYNKAMLEDSTNIIAPLNKANAVYKNNRADEAITELDKFSYKTNDNAAKEKAFYNKGAILSAQKKLEESIEAYKSALRLDPNDKEARENLQKALKELSKKNPPKKQDHKDQKQNKQQQQSKMNQKEAEQRLDLLEQKEKQVQQRMQKEKSKQNSGLPKDW